MSAIGNAKEFIEGGDPTLDARAFRRCLGQFATGIVIATTEVGNVRVGVTANSFTSVSLDPPLVLWAIGKKSRSFQTFSECEQFAVNVLAADQIELSRQFSGSSDDKFAGTALVEGKSKMPLIDGALAHLECNVENRIDTGDHMVMIGRVLNYMNYKGDPLLFSQGKYGIAEEHPSIKRSILDDQPGENPTFWGDDLISLIFEAHYRLSAEFDHSRALLNITAPAARILAALYSDGPMSFDRLVRMTFLGELNAEDILSSMTARGLLTRSSEGEFALTASGRRIREENRNSWNAFCLSETQSIALEDVQRACRALGQLIKQNREGEMRRASLAS